MFLIQLLKKCNFAFTVKKHLAHFRRFLSVFIALAFLLSSILPSYAQSALNLPIPGTMVGPSLAFVPVLLKGMTIDPKNPLYFDFIVDSGNTKFTQDQIKEESNRLVKYFLAAMTVPQDDLWVNLSPYEKDRIVPDALGKTELGRDMLAQDYILKQLTASLIYPEKELGKKFWEKVYAKAYEKFGTTKIPEDTFNKVWIVPQEATVFENGNAVYIVKSRLRVMMEEDYLALSRSSESSSVKREANASRNALASDIVREIILPEIECEVNEGENFAPIRQIYQSLILAQWYKETIKESLLSKVYIDQKKIKGVDLFDPTIKDQIYARYVESFKKGVFDFIKTEYDQPSQRVIPRKYFSGGEKFGKIPLNRIQELGVSSSSPVGDDYKLSLRIEPQKVVDLIDELATNRKKIESLIGGGLFQEAILAYKDYLQRIQAEKGKSVEFKIISDLEFEELEKKAEEEVIALERDISVQILNAGMIQSGDFIDDINKLLKHFSKSDLNKNEYFKARALAFEINRRLASRDGVLEFIREKRMDKFPEGITDPENDRYNRVLEGVVQILNKSDYGDNVIFNPWGYTKEEMGRNLDVATERFTQIFLSGLVGGIKRILLLRGSLQNAPPEVLAALKEIELLSGNEIKEMSTENLEKLALPIVTSEKGLTIFEELLGDSGFLEEMFFLYSAGPATGKGTIEDVFLDKYGAFVEKMFLFHTRAPRLKKGVIEKDGVVYNFRTEKELRDLVASGDVIPATVNMQEQGIAKKKFTDTITIKKSDLSPNTIKAEELTNPEAKDRVADDKKYIRIEGLDEIVNETADAITVKRTIYGLEDVFKGKKLVYLEGGYHWFLQLKKKYPHITVAFIAPFEDDETELRGEISEWIGNTFTDPNHVRLSFEALARIVADKKGKLSEVKKDYKSFISDYVSGADQTMNVLLAKELKIFLFSLDHSKSQEALENILLFFKGNRDEVFEKVILPQLEKSGFIKSMVENMMKVVGLPREIVALDNREAFRRNQPKYKGSNIFELVDEQSYQYFQIAVEGLSNSNQIIAKGHFEKIVNYFKTEDVTMRDMEEVIYRFIKIISVNADPLGERKAIAHQSAVEALPFLNDQLNKKSEDERINLVVEFAIKGNRFGTSQFLKISGLADREERLDLILKEFIDLIRISKDDRPEFIKDMKNEDNQNYLFILDNVIEDVSYFLLIRELLQRGKNVKIVVKTAEADNDATFKDMENLFKKQEIFYFFGKNYMEEDVLNIVESGSATKTTDVRRLKQGFIDAWKEADVIVLSGEGNRGGLITPAGLTKDVYSMMVAKSNHEAAGINLGDGVIEKISSEILLGGSHVASIEKTGEEELSKIITREIKDSSAIDDEVSSSAVGGIDMNKVNLNRQGSGIDINFDPVMMQDILNNGVDGFVPVIINLTPINSILPLLGIETEEEDNGVELSLLK